MLGCTEFFWDKIWAWECYKEKLCKQADVWGLRFEWLWISRSYCLVIVPCHFVCWYQHFRGTVFLHFQDCQDCGCMSSESYVPVYQTTWHYSESLILEEMHFPDTTCIHWDREWPRHHTKGYWLHWKPVPYHTRGLLQAARVCRAEFGKSKGKRLMVEIEFELAIMH